MEIQSQNIASELQISELKQSNLYKSYEQFHSQASSMLVFSVQWKDLETHFDSTRKSIQTSIETLSEREKDFSLREKELATRESLMESGFESKKKQLETHFSEREKASSLRENELATRESRFESVFESKKKEFESLERLVRERVKEIELSLRQSDSLKTLIMENRKELEIKESEFKAIESSIAVKSSELDRLKGSVEEQEKKLERTEDCAEVVRKKVLSLGKKVKQLNEEIASKQRVFKEDIASEEKVLKELRENVVSKEDEIKACQSSIERLEKEIQWKGDKLKSVSTELKSKEEQVRARKSSMDKLEKEIQLKEDKLKAVSGSIASCSSELESVRKEIESKEKSFVSLTNSAEKITRACEKRESEVERLSKKLESEEKSLESKIKEYNLIRDKVEDCLGEVESREKNLQSLQNSLDKAFNDLEIKERQFEKRVIESTCSRVIKDESLECVQSKNAMVLCSASNQTLRAIEGRDLRLLLNRHLKTHDSVCEEVFSILRASANPPKLALEAVEGLYPSNSSEESMEFSVSVIRRSCILMLEQLEKLLMEKFPPPIVFEVGEEAKRFAKSWRAKMKETEPNYLEALGFLQFLTSFRLTSEFDPNEIYELREAISTADREFVVPEIDPLVSVMTRPPMVEVNTMVNICTILEKSTDPSRSVLQYVRRGLLSHSFPGLNVLLNCIILFDQLLKVSPHIRPLVREEAARVAADWKENIESRGESTLDALVFLQFLDTYDLVPLFGVDEILKLLMKISRDSKVSEVCCQVGFAKRIPDIIRYLIGKRNIFDAVKLSCTFKLAEEYEPVKLLTKYMDDLKKYTTRNCKTKAKKPIEVKERITGEEITALMAVKDCVIEYNLDRPILPLELINSRIKFLENGMVQRRLALAEVPPRKRKRVRGPGGGFDNHHEQGRHKLPRSPSSG